MSSISLFKLLECQARRVVDTKYASDLLLTSSSNLAITLMGAISGILTARILGAAGRGELASAVVWAAILGALATLGLPQALIYISARSTDYVEEILTTTLALMFMQSAVTCIAGYFLVDLLFDASKSSTRFVVKLYLASIPLNLITTYLSTIAQGMQNFRLSNGIRFMAAFGYFFAIILAAMFGWSNSKFIISLALTMQFMVAGVSLIVFIKILPWRPSFNRVLARDLLQYGLKSYMGSLSWLANARVDQFVMSLVLNTRDIGYYAVAVSYASLLFPMSGAFASTIFPRIAKSQANEAHRTIISALKINTAVATLIAIIMFLAGPLIIPFVFGAEYQYSVLPSSILLPGTVVLGCNYVLSDGLRGLGFPGKVSFAEFIGLVITIIGLILFLPPFGILGAATVSLICYSIVLISLLRIWLSLKSTQTRDL